jgi:maltose/moltooligosaccharide transporter
LFGWYNFFALIFAFLLTPLAKKTSRKFVHMLALISGGVGLLSMHLINDPNMLIISMLGIGFAWASILSMPYALLIDTLPSNKMGVYMGIFNFFIVIPQIINALIGGPIVHTLFADYAIYYLVFGGVLFILAGLLTLRIREPLFNEVELKEMQRRDALLKVTRQ